MAAVCGAAAALMGAGQSEVTTMLGNRSMHPRLGVHYRADDCIPDAVAFDFERCQVDHAAFTVCPLARAPPPRCRRDAPQEGASEAYRALADVYTELHGVRAGR